MLFSFSYNSASSSASVSYFYYNTYMDNCQKKYLSTHGSRDSSSCSTPASQAIPPHNSAVAWSSTSSSHTASGGFYIPGPIIFTLGCSYASVPLYQLYRQASGYGGTVQTGFWKAPVDLVKPPAFLLGPVPSSGSSPLPDSSFRLSSSDPFDKQITVHFNADQSVDTPCSFKPQIPKIKVYPGDTASTFYIAHNQSDRPVVGVSTYHVTPQKVGIHSNKIQCSCSEEQRSQPRETIELPILFLIDPEFFKDPKMLDVDTITLSYTFRVS
jgi:cytochrome c oxidase assembly protein subunit 11